MYHVYISMINCGEKKNHVIGVVLHFSRLHFINDFTTFNENAVVPRHFVWISVLSKASYIVLSRFSRGARYLELAVRLV